MLWISAALHVGFLCMALVTSAPSSVSPPAVISVELVADPTAARTQTARVAPPKPTPKAAAPKPEPVPEPPKPKPKPAKTLLPAKPSEPKPAPRAEKAPAPREEVVLDPRKEEKSLDDLLADFREEQGEPEPAPAAAPATRTAAVPVPGARGGTGRVSPEVAAWTRRAEIHVRRNWVVPPGFRNEPLQAHVVVKLDAQGNVQGVPEIAERSGNPWYDEGVVRSIQKASPLPPPPEAGEWDFYFRPEDY